ncbi:MAG: filamentous hemagglutinin N-terminal domain-containing protein [Leptolyngbyaceae cyanobacterium bins.349]|nr:filamentous hemagglutinin N-terminal domain-containing protein [Leptolyngbyaceae cyanobacterium bins.349]
MASKQLRLRQIGFAFIQYLLVLGGFLCGSFHIAVAQRIPVADDTLGSERSLVSPNTVINGIPSNQIDGGAQRGSNLFHSFREFNIDAGRGVYFSNPAGIVNILTRVTGGVRSDIFGTLGVLGNANLFLLNPNGILFGPNARLDIRGSFFASTASSILFDHGFAFSTTNPQAPPLLAVNVPVGLQYGSNPGAIQTQGANLQVQNGQTLTLAGGTVNIDGGQLLAPGGRVELAGVGNAGTVGLTQQGQEWRLSLPDGLARADVGIGNDAFVDVSSGGGGSIAITAQNLTVTGYYTQVLAGIAGNLGSVGTQAGDIDINATEAVSLDESFIANDVQPGGIGNAGGINLSASSLTVKNGAQLSASTSGEGDAGSLKLTVSGAATFDGTTPDGQFASGAFSLVAQGARGRGGNIEIIASSLEVSRGAYLTASVFGKGTAGNVKLIVSGAAIFDGVALAPNRGSGFASSGIFNESREGRSGNITIQADSLSIKDGAKVISSNIGQADAGNIIINVTNAVSVSGLYKDGRKPTSPEDDGSISSGIFSVKKNGGGNAGTINITAGSLSVSDGAVLGVSLFDAGNAGNIIIEARGEVSFDGIGQPNYGSAVPLASGAYTSVTQGATGNGGDILITASSLNLSNGAVLNSNTAGVGKAGNITLSTPIVEIIGGGKILAATESIGRGGTITMNASTAVNLTRVQDFSPVISVEASGAGKAGDILINTPSLTLSDLARITATATAKSTNLEGGGSITLNASNLNLAGIVGVFAETQGQSPAGTLRLNPYNNQPDLDIRLTPNSQISASTSGSGRGGNLIATAPQSITVTGPGKLAVETSSVGNAGNMTFTTRQLTLQDGVEVTASTSGSGRAGNIGVNAEVLDVSGGARISTNTSNNGQAGDLTVNLRERLTLTGNGTGLFASTTPGSTGNGGNIRIDPDLVLIQDGATIAVNSQGRGTGGNIFLQANRLELRDRGSITAETASAQGGNITLDVRDLLLLRRNSTISATAGTAQAGGDGGNITISSPNGFIVGVRNENSDITANAFTGSGGRVNITAQGIYGLQFQPNLTPFSDITASSTFGVSGVVTLNTPNVDPNRGLVQLPVDLTDASRLIVQTCPTGDSLAKPPNEFIVTGRGGLPPTPSEAMNRDAIQVDLVTTDASHSPLISQNESPLPPSTPSPPSSPFPTLPILEAQTFQIAANGTVFLVATAPKTAIAPSLNHLIHCR